MVDLEFLKERLSKWGDSPNVTNLNKKWVNAKKYIIKESSSIEERFELDRLIEDSYASALNSILNK